MNPWLQAASWLPRLLLQAGEARSYARAAARGIGAQGNWPAHHEAKGGQPQQVRAAALQLPLEAVGSTPDYVDWLLPFFRQAVEEGAQLLVFPEDITLPLAGALPLVRDLVDQPLEDALPGHALVPSPGTAMRLLAPAFNAVHHAVFQEFSRVLGVYVVAGSVFEPQPGGELYNVCHLYGPGGERVASQPKCHLLPLERDWGFSAGGEFRVHDTAVGRLAIPVCMDATYFESFRLAQLLGAEIVTLPVANPEPFDYWRDLRGLWPRVQESKVYGVRSCLTGSIFGLTLEGKAAIMAPVEWEQGKQGVICMSDDPRREAVLVAELDLSLPRQARVEAGQTLNPGLYERYLPRLYGDLVAQELQ